MKRIGDLMKELGFDPSAPRGAQEAFVKHLIRAAEGVSVQTPSERNEIKRHPESVRELAPKGQQLSFDFDSAPNPRPGENKAKAPA